MNEIFHTHNQIPILSFIFSLILLSGLFYIGQLIIKKTFLNNLLKSFSETKYQALIISGNLIILISFPIVLFLNFLTIVYITILAYIIFALGIFQIFIFLKNKVVFSSFKNFTKKDLFSIFVLLGLFGYFLISAGPVTNADSLDYHLFISKFIINEGRIPNFSTHFHSKLVGAGEVIISIGLIAGTEQLNSMLQFFGLLSIFGLLKKSCKNYIFFFAVVLGCPVIIFFVSTIKPHLFHIAANSLIFALIFLDQTKRSEKENLLKYLFSIAILSLSVQAKFSFLLAFVLMASFIFYESLKNKLFVKTTIYSSIILLFTYLPFIYWKYLEYEYSIINLFLQPFPTNDPAEQRFMYYLINAGRGGNPLLGIIFPGNLNTLTNSLGPGAFLFFLLFKDLRKNFKVIILIFLFILIGYFKGQPSSRFFLEPFIWVILALSLTFHKSKIEKFFENILKIQYLLFLTAIVFGALSIFPGTLTTSLMFDVLEKNANGYSLFKWANKKLDDLNYYGPIISTHRSIAYSKNLPISQDFIWLTEINKLKYKKYADEIYNLKPKYIVSTSASHYHEYFNNCDLVLVAKKENLGMHAMRKPFSKGNYYDGYIFSINHNKLPKCFSKKYE